MGGLDLIVIDGLQYVASPTHVLKKIAVEMDCPILMVSTLAHGDPKDNRCPNITDLIATDYEEMYSDVIMFLHKVDEDEYDLIIAKNRSRREGVVKLRPRLEYYKFANYK